MSELFNNLWNALLALLAIVALVLFVRLIANGERNGRAAYLEGRYGVDAPAALQLATKGGAE